MLLYGHSLCIYKLTWVWKSCRKLITLLLSWNAMALMSIRASHTCERLWWGKKFTPNDNDTLYWNDKSSYCIKLSKSYPMIYLAIQKRCYRRLHVNGSHTIRNYVVHRQLCCNNIHFTIYTIFQDIFRCRSQNLNRNYCAGILLFTHQIK